MNRIKDNMLKYEKLLCNYAAKESDAIRMLHDQEDVRPAYFHDSDRIIHSLSFTRYINKTQVFSNCENDHITKRVIHVQLVSKIARTIGRALNLNEDLIEAIALGHDIGHIPFGHTGESILSEISYKYTGRYFYHNIHSVRTLMYVENKGNGYNLTIQTLDGIMCHNGEFALKEYYPRNKTQEEFLKEYQDSYQSKTLCQKMKPMTLEGCVVRISDIIGYLGRDIEDAIQLGIIKKEQIPTKVKRILGETNREIVNTIVLDIIKNSIDQPYVKLSDEIFEAIVELKDFNYKNIYKKATSKEKIEEYKMMFETLFLCCCKQIENEEKQEKIYKVFLDEMNENYLKNTSKEQKVIDYIAGMTDEYFLKEYSLIKTKK